MFIDPKTIRFDYGFDQLGRRLYEQRDLATGDGYKYNARDELKAFNKDGAVNTTTGVVTGGGTMSTVYDGSGNRQSTTTNGIATTFAINSLNQYESTSALGTLDHDNKGNLTLVQGWTYVYDAQNRLTALDNVALNVHIKQHYDPMNRLIARDNNGVVMSYMWENWNMLQERNAAGAIQRQYLWGANQNELVEAFGGGLPNVWYFQDGRGNTAAASGDAGRLLERYRYGWAGNVFFYDAGNISRPSTFDTRFLFAGSQYLPEASLYDMRNRFYHPTLSRFMQADPVGLQVAGMKPSAIAAAFFPAGTAPEKFTSTELNLYRYCGNDFANRTDAMGLEFNDQGYGFTDQPSSADFGYTGGTINARTGITPTNGGYTARLIDVDLTVRSTIRSQTKQSYDPNWDHKGPDLFKRSASNVERTIKHEGDHRDNNRKWYDTNHGPLIKDVNSGKKVYKTAEAAAKDVQRKVDSAYQKFSQPDISHTSKDWKDWNPPQLERIHP